MKRLRWTLPLGLLAFGLGFGCSFLIDAAGEVGEGTQCGATTCTEGQTCVEGVCVDPLAESCEPGGCGETAECVNGKCLQRNCAAKACAAGAVCIDDTCVAVACVGKSCPEGEKCANGQCLPTACGGTQCGAGEVCFGGACVQRGCEDLACPGDSRCLQGECVACAASETVCSDGEDDDCDGLPDCLDPDCQGSSCNDGNGCTQGDTCDEGSCVPGAAIDCSAQTPPNGCVGPSNTCDPATGQCVFPPLPAATTCDDGSGCTDDDVCDGQGACAGTPNGCAAPPPCQTGSGVCDPTTKECTYTPLADGTACRDESSCSPAGTCRAGVCVTPTATVCNTPPNDCYEARGSCRSGTCVYTPKMAGRNCEDGSQCTSRDKCDGRGHCDPGPEKSCSNPPNDCRRNNGTCNPRSGECSYEVKPQGSDCDDGNACTGAGNCDGNRCRKGRDVGDGRSCGRADSRRCCGGACVDISNNARHCGGCFANCGGGNACRSISSTGCSNSPPNRSGRCECHTTQTCPRGRNGNVQTCRNQSPGAWLCSPETEGYCKPNTRWVDLSGCPNYCFYP